MPSQSEPPEQIACSQNWNPCGGSWVSTSSGSVGTRRNRAAPAQENVSPSPHTLIDDLRDAGVQDSLIKRIAGHEDGAVTFSIYGSRSPLKTMAEAPDHIDIRPST
jgi:hypothetical protein